MTKLPLLLLTVLTLLTVSVIAAHISTTWDDFDLTTTTNGSSYNASEKQLSSTYGSTLYSLTYTEVNTVNASNCSETFTLYYGDSSPATSTSTGAANKANGTNIIAEIDLTSITSTRYVKPTWANTIYGANGSEINCTITDIQLDYGVYLSDTMSGMPGIGSDIGKFLTKLAPGVGTFIVILAVLSGIGGLLWAVVGMIKSKLSMQE